LINGYLGRLNAGVSNSVSYAGHILTKIGLAGSIKRKNVSAGHNRRLKVPLYYKNSSFNNNLSNFNDVADRKNTSGGPHAARGPRV
jgi:hypothetical protein